VAELPLAEDLQEVSLIDVGSDTARRHLVRGWYLDEMAGDGTSFAWSEGAESEIEFALLKVRDLVAELRCRPLEIPGEGRQTVSIVVNGNDLQELRLASGFASYRLPLPASALREGRNRVVLRYRYAVSPRELGRSDDWRRLAIAVDWLRLGAGENPPPPEASADGSGLLLPGGSALRYHLRHRSGLRLEVDSVSAPAGGRGGVECRVVAGDGRLVAIDQLAVGDSSIQIGLDGPEGAPFRLELRAYPGAEPGVQWPVLRVDRPILTVPRRAPAAAVAPDRGTTPTAGAPVSVVIYLVDALRADRLGVYGQQRDLSPNLDRFAQRATVYERAWAQASWTRPAVASIFTGLRPEVHGANGRLDRLTDAVATLAERFADGGYDTAAVVANPNCSAEFGFARGFDTFVLMEADRRRSMYLNDEVERWLTEREPARPFLLYVHTVDPHLPYQPPEPYRAEFAAGVERHDLGSTEVVGTLQARDLLDEDRYAPDLLALYDAEVACNDHSFGQLLELLERRGHSEDTVVVFVSDHGEEFFDHGGWIHGRTLYREVLQVPLVIRSPGQQDARRVSAPVQHVDLLPTLLELAGLDPQPGIHGTSLVRPPDPDRSVAGFLDLDGWGGWSVVEGRLQAIRHRVHGYTGPAELYHLERDPGQHNDLGGERGIEADALLSGSRRGVLSEEGRYTVDQAEIDDELRRRLEALGYL
jgi:arylsulfatase A-like enzyme